MEEAFYRIFNEIAEKTVENDVKYLLISGDMFDRYNPPISVVLRTVGTLKKLRDKGIRVVVVPGNHDISRIKTGILNLLSEAGLINLLDFTEEKSWLVLHPHVFEDDKLVFYGIPGFRGSSSREVEYMKQNLVRFDRLQGFNRYQVIILAHINTKFAGYDPSRYQSRYGRLYLDHEDLLKRLPSNTKYVALGHIHLPIPLDRSFRGNIAYPGAPIGIDINDLLETSELAKLNVRRRILLVDISSEPPLIKSLELESSPGVQYTRLRVKNAEELKDHLNELIDDIEQSKYLALIIDVEGLDRLTSDIENYKREVEKRKGVFIKIRVRSRTQEQILPMGLSDVTVSYRDLSISEIEMAILQELVSKTKLGISADKLKWIIDTLGSLQEINYDKLLEIIVKEIGEG